MRHLTRSTQRLFSQNVVLQFKDLKEGKNLQELMEKAYGPQGSSSFI